MMKCISFLLLVFLNFSLLANSFSESKSKNIYSGGMHIFQPSIVTMQNPHGEFATNGSGIGGMLRFYLTSYFAAGIYGGSLRADYKTNNSDNSYVNLGHGGVFLGLTHKSGKWRYNASFGVGRGSIKNLHIAAQESEVLTEAYLYDFGTIVYVPFIGIDREITKRLLFTAQISYFMADNMNYQSPVLQIGLLFNR